MDVLKLGQREFVYRGFTWAVSNEISDLVAQKRVILQTDGSQTENDVTVDADFVENYFKDEDWFLVFRKALKVQPYVKGEHLLYEEYLDIPFEIGAEVKKNLFENLDWLPIAKRSLALYVQRWVSYLEKLKQSTEKAPETPSVS
jgi:hypothetical protein